MIFINTEYNTQDYAINLCAYNTSWLHAITTYVLSAEGILREFRIFITLSFIITSRALSNCGSCNMFWELFCVFNTIIVFLVVSQNEK